MSEPETETVNMSEWLRSHLDPEIYLNDIPYSLARQAHAGTSFTPEKRADQERTGYANTLVSDLTAMARYATTDAKLATLREEFERYRAGYASHVRARLSAQSRIVSPMISGPSNFPSRRMAKRNATEHKRLDELVSYRERALAAIRKALQPELRPIMAGDDDATDRLAAKIAKAEAAQAAYKAINGAIRKHAKAGPDAQVAALVALGYTETLARKFLEPDFCGRIGIPAYELTNNNANIRRMKERLASVSVAKVAETTEVVGEHAKLEDCPADNRVRLFYPGKPSADVRTRLKGAGFRWTPSLGCWQAYRNHRTLVVASREAGSPLITGSDGYEPECPEETAAAELAESAVSS